MANPEHEAILNQGVEVWNKWRQDNPNVKPDLSYTNLSGLNLSYVDFHGAKLGWANLSKATLHFANFNEAYLSEANFSEALPIDAVFKSAYSRAANFSKAILRGADFSGAYLGDAYFHEAYLREASLRAADLTGARLNHANLIGAELAEANFENADISDCRIFGVAAWKLMNIENLTQINLTVTEGYEPQITVDNLDVAQFVYLLLNNAKLRNVIETLTIKSVLILGLFKERKAVLNGIREALRQYDYVPILLDFDNPANHKRDLTETVMTLAKLSRFVIADLSDPKSIPHELMSFVDKLFSVPVQGIFCPTNAHPNPYPMYEHLQRLPHVLPIYRYETANSLLTSLEEKVIQPAEEKVKQVRPP